MEFIPDSHEAVDVPFFDDVTSEGGWQGHSTTKSIQVLQSEITVALSRLGALVMSFQSGIYHVNGVERPGFQIRYVVERGGEKQTMPGQIDIAALPVRNKPSMRKTYDKRVLKARKQALYMLRMALDGTWFLQRLSPGYSALIPWMLTESGKTIGQLWGESVLSNLLPPGDSEFLEGEIVEE